MTGQERRQRWERVTAEEVTEARSGGQGAPGHKAERERRVQGLRPCSELQEAGMGRPPAASLRSSDEWQRQRTRGRGLRARREELQERPAHDHQPRVSSGRRPLLVIPSHLRAPRTSWGYLAHPPLPSCPQKPLRLCSLTPSPVCQAGSALPASTSWHPPLCIHSKHPKPRLLRTPFPGAFSQLTMGREASVSPHFGSLPRPTLWAGCSAHSMPEALSTRPSRGASLVGRQGCLR